MKDAIFYVEETKPKNENIQNERQSLQILAKHRSLSLVE